MSKKARIGILLATIIGIVVLSVWTRERFRGTAPEEELLLYGNIDIRQVDLAFNNSDRVEAILVEEGDAVRQGQLLATLKKARFELAVAEAQSQVEAQQQVVARLEAGSRPAEIRRARAEVKAIQADVNDARARYQRMEGLVESDAVALQTRDDALSCLNRTEAQLEATEATLQLLLEGPRSEEIAAAKAALDGYRAELALAKEHRADANLVAPGDGVIQNRLLEVGDMASPQRPALTMALTTPVWVRAYVDEPDLGRIYPRMPATVRTDSFPRKRYAGWVGFISPTAEFTPKSVQTPQLRTQLVYQVRVIVTDPNSELRLGMPVTVHVNLKDRVEVDLPDSTDIGTD